VKVNNKNNSYFKDIKKDTLELHIAHNEGNYFCSKEQIKEINDNNQIALYYSDKDGKINENNNPNGSIKNIAGVFNKEKNVLGMMPHPERMIDLDLSGEDGSIFFKNLINNLK
jgi:phosphoribosylformylglycinamidine synthase